MFELALRTALILGLAWMIARLLPRAAAATRHLIWHLSVIAVLAAPIIAPIAPEFKVPGVPGVSQDLRRDGSRTVPTDTATPKEPNTADTPNTPRTLNSPGTLNTPGTLSTLGTLGTLMWAAGSVTLAVWFALGWLATAASVRRARPAPAPWQIEVNALRERLRISRAVTIRVLSTDTSPIVAGLWCTTILLPEAARGWDADRRRSVLLHELAHIRRGDLHVQVLAQTACAAYWFNPLAWIAFARLRSERERACDDEVLRTGARPSAYASHLLEIARALDPTRPSAALAMARPSELEGRLLAVLATGRVRAPARATRWAVAVTLGVVTVAALGATPASMSVGREDATPAAAPSAKPRALGGLGQDAPTPTERLAARRAVRQAAEALESSQDAEARERAVMELAASGQTSTIRPLEAALADTDQDVREKAALGLALMSSPDAIPGLLMALSDPDAQVREKAAIGLALRRDARVFEALVAAMDDPDAQVREKVAIALGTSGDARAAAALERALQDPDAHVREKAVTGMLLLRGIAVDATQGDQAREGLRGLLGAFIAFTK